MAGGTCQHPGAHGVCMFPPSCRDWGTVIPSGQFLVRSLLGYFRWGFFTFKPLPIQFFFSMKKIPFQESKKWARWGAESSLVHARKKSALVRGRWPYKKMAVSRTVWEEGSTSPERGVGGKKQFGDCRRQHVLGIKALSSARWNLFCRWTECRTETSSLSSPQ